MSENDWDDIPKEELLKVAPALIYLKKTFGTEVGNPIPSKPPVEPKKEKS